MMLNVGKRSEERLAQRRSTVVQISVIHLPDLRGAP